MRLIALEREAPGAQSLRFTAEILEAEAETVWQLQQSEVIRELYFRTDRNEAILILECASAEDAERKLSELPLVRAGLIRFEIIPLRPYDGFARLFRQRPQESAP